MKIVLDTNVLLSGIFFGGVPGKILQAWKSGRILLALSPAILDEYRRAGAELEERYGDLGLSALLAVLVGNAEVVDDAPLQERVCSDPDDEKFLACASAAGASVIVSGDEDLLSLGSWEGVRILFPRQFVDSCLSPEGT